MEIFENYKYERGPVDGNTSGKVVISDIYLDSQGLRAREHERSSGGFFWDVQIERDDIVGKFDEFDPDGKDEGWREDGFAQDVRVLFEQWNLKTENDYWWFQLPVRFEAFSHLLEFRAPLVAKMLCNLGSLQLECASRMSEEKVLGDPVTLGIDRARLDKVLSDLLQRFGGLRCEQERKQIEDGVYKRAMAESIMYLADSLDADAAQEYVDGLGELALGILGGEKEPENYYHQPLFALLECLKEQEKVVDTKEIAKHLTINSFSLVPPKKTQEE